MTHNPVIIAYLPPETSGKFHTSSFLENLRKNPPRYPLVTFSEVADFKPNLQLKRSPEIPDLMRPNEQGLTFGVNNLIFMLAFGFAWRMGYSDMLYLEADVRVRGKDWDVPIFESFYADPNPNYVSGTIACYNPCNTDRKFWLRYCELISRFNKGGKDTKAERNFPIATWGWKGDLPPLTFGSKGAANNTGSSVFVNGAGGIYSIGALRTLFPELQHHDDNETKVTLARDIAPWDMEIGKRLFTMFRDQVFDVVHHNPHVYSTYSDTITTEDERLAMLRAGAVNLIHQVKSPIME